MFDQLHYVPSGLLTHPEFQQGLEYGGEWFDQEYGDRPITQTTVTHFLAEIFSDQAREKNVRFAQAMGLPAPSFLYTVGFVVHWLDKALAASSRER